MSDFWNKNKGSIKSGLLTAGKYGYQGTKYVAKTGYHLGKNQYNAHKGKGQNNNNNTDSDTERNDAVSIDRLSDPKSFPAPPLRQGQKQYAGNGKIVSANEAPILNIPPGTQAVNQQTIAANNQYQNQPQQNYVNYQYNTTDTLQVNGYQQQQNLSQPLSHNITPQKPNDQYIAQYNEVPISSQNYVSTANFQNGTQNQQLGNTPLQTQYMQATQQFKPQPLLNEIQRPLPVPPPRPPIPVRQQTNNFERSESINSTPSSIGPHFEVTPFNREEYEEKKKQPAIILPEVDLSKFAPPPMHKDRSNADSSTGNSPSITVKHSQRDTPFNQSSNNIISSSPEIGQIATTTNAEFSQTSTVDMSETLTSPNNSVENIEQNKKEEEKVNNTVSGTYHEPIVNFSPPPQPHRRIDNEGSRSVNNSYSPQVYSPAPIGNHQSISQPPPLLPKRNINNKKSEDNSNQSMEQNIEENNLGNDDMQTNNPITGVYTARNVKFQPPPKPFRRDSNVGESRTLTRKSSSSYAESFPAPTLPEKHKQSTSISNDKKSVINTGASYIEEPSTKSITHPISEFEPPPKPFRSNTSKNNVQDKLDEIHEHEQSASHYNNLSKPQSRSILSFNHNDTINLSNKPKEETIPVQNISSHSNSPSNPSNTFIQELNSTITNMSIHDTKKHKSTPPPPVKPKPQALNKILFEKAHSASILKNYSEASKKQPPAVKPKPKNLDNILNSNDATDETSINSLKTNTSNSIVDHPHIERAAKESIQTPSPLIREQPPIPPSRRVQPLIPQNTWKQPPIPKYHNDTFVPTNRRARMPLPNEIDNGSRESIGSQSNDDDINPFAIYKKEAVPASHDRIHTN